MDDKVISTIRKLLALGNSDNVNESQAAIAAAQAIMDKYRITSAEIEAAGENGAAKEKPIKDEKPILEGARIFAWRKTLLSTICKHNDCAHYFMHNHRDTRYYVFGRSSDLEVMRSMFVYAETQVASFCKRHCKGMGHVYAENWCTGAVAGIAEKLNEARKAARASSACTTTALVLLDNRSAEAKEEMYNQVHGLRSVSIVRHSQRDMTAYNHGRVVGNMCIDLGGNKGLPGGGNKLLG